VKLLCRSQELSTLMLIEPRLAFHFGWGVCMPFADLPTSLPTYLLSALHPSIRPSACLFP